MKKIAGKTAVNYRKEGERVRNQFMDDLMALASRYYSAQTSLATRRGIADSRARKLEKLNRVKK